MNKISIGNRIMFDEQEPGILLGEIELAVLKLKKNKTPVSDGVTAKMLKLYGGKGAKILWKLCNKV